MSKVRSASYDVISDNAVSLGIGIVGGTTLRDFDIGLDDGADVGIRSVLSYKVAAVDPSELEVKLTITNGNNVTTEISKGMLSSNVTRVFQEVVARNVLTAKANKLRVKVMSGTGMLRISDIVLMYQKNAPVTV